MHAHSRNRIPGGLAKCELYVFTYVCRWTSCYWEYDKVVKVLRQVCVKNNILLKASQIESTFFQITFDLIHCSCRSYSNMNISNEMRRNF